MYFVWYEYDIKSSDLGLRKIKEINEFDGEKWVFKNIILLHWQ